MVSSAEETETLLALSADQRTAVVFPVLFIAEQIVGHHEDSISSFVQLEKVREVDFGLLKRLRQGLNWVFLIKHEVFVCSRNS